MPKATWNGTVLAQSEKFEMVEGNIYFPHDSVTWDHFSKGTREYTCPWKGKATYYDISAGGKKNDNAAWSYPNPLPAANNIKGYVAFETGKGIQVES
ncbi:Nucleotidyltransferase [Dehalogenimonas formicexedens]|uniref:Nucleotidyltransferase n=1 Tax=Dehalogenimonas formicexedens TaxID=1839801 RepID=A0A1P8F5U5_9CHLR|nr:DUF427 domain-containing protein [Dehalogenimonas formicexedens]APV43722.1 Nucleotidyltransferase [Dehalogenimonas formicexedens]